MEFIALERLTKNCDWSGLFKEIGNFGGDRLLSISYRLLPQVLEAVIKGPGNSDLLQVLDMLVDPTEAKDLALYSGVIPVLIGLLDDKNLRIDSLKAMTRVLYTVNYEDAIRNILAIDSVPKIVEILRNGDVEEKRTAIRGLKSFAKCNSKSTPSKASQRETLIHAGVVPILSSILKSDLSSLHHCASVLLATVLYEVPQEARLQVEDEAVLRLIEMTRSSVSDTQYKGLNALYIINYICVRKILYNQELLNNLVNLMNSTDKQVQTHATKLAFIILLDKSENKDGKFYLVESGVIPILARNIEEGDNVKLRLKSMEALISVCENVEKFREMVPSSLNSIVKRLKLSESIEERGVARRLLTVLTNSVTYKAPTEKRVQDDKYRPPLNNACYDWERDDDLFHRRVVRDEVTGSSTLHQRLFKNSRTNNCRHTL